MMRAFIPRTLVGVTSFVLALFLNHVSLATDLPSNQSDENEIRALASQIEKKCITSMTAKQPINNGKDYASRITALTQDIFSPERFCSCTAKGAWSLPPSVIKTGDKNAAISHFSAVSSACAVQFWRADFAKLCNGVRNEMIKSYAIKVGKVDVEKSERICSCAANQLKSLTDSEITALLSRSTDEFVSAPSSLNKFLKPSKQSFSGLFASCGAQRIGDVFGIEQVGSH